MFVTSCLLDPPSNLLHIRCTSKAAVKFHKQIVGVSPALDTAKALSEQALPEAAAEQDLATEGCPTSSNITFVNLAEISHEMQMNAADSTAYFRKQGSCVLSHPQAGLRTCSPRLRTICSRPDASDNCWRDIGISQGTTSGRTKRFRTANETAQSNEESGTNLISERVQKIHLCVEPNRATKSHQSDTQTSQRRSELSRTAGKGNQYRSLLEPYQASMIITQDLVSQCACLEALQQQYEQVSQDGHSAVFRVAGTVKDDPTIQHLQQGAVAIPSPRVKLELGIQ